MLDTPLCVSNTHMGASSTFLGVSNTILGVYNTHLSVSSTHLGVSNTIQACLARLDEEGLAPQEARCIAGGVTRQRLLLFCVWVWGSGFR